MWKYSLNLGLLTRRLSLSSSVPDLVLLALTVRKIHCDVLGRSVRDENGYVVEPVGRGEAAAAAADRGGGRVARLALGTSPTCRHLRVINAFC